MEKKQSNLCVAANVSTTKDSLALPEKVSLMLAYVKEIHNFSRMSYANIIIARMNQVRDSVEHILETSTLTMSTDPYPLSTSHKAVEQEKESDKLEAQQKPTENGIEAMSNGDEEMVDAEVEEEKMHEIESKGMETKNKP
ncbi:hypothetical protein ACLOJK_008944 [Asimina triloba]